VVWQPLREGVLVRITSAHPPSMAGARAGGGGLCSPQCAR
jgi:hypothetical protein